MCGSLNIKFINIKLTKTISLLTLAFVSAGSLSA